MVVIRRPEIRHFSAIYLTLDGQERGDDVLAFRGHRLTAGCLNHPNHGAKTFEYRVSGEKSVYRYQPKQVAENPDILGSSVSEGFCLIRSFMPLYAEIQMYRYGGLNPNGSSVVLIGLVGPMLHRFQCSFPN